MTGSSDSSDEADTEHIRIGRTQGVRDSWRARGAVHRSRFAGARPGRDRARPRRAVAVGGVIGCLQSLSESTTSSGGNHGAHDVVDAGFEPGFEAEDIGPYQPRAIVEPRFAKRGMPTFRRRRSLNRCTVATLTYQRIPAMPNGCTGKWMQRFATRRTPHSPTIATVQRFGNRRGREGAQPTPRNARRSRSTTGPRSATKSSLWPCQIRMTLPPISSGLRKKPRRSRRPFSARGSMWSISS